MWRWHFYAGLIVAPFLLVMALTGSTYLFREELNDLIYPAQRFVTPHQVDVPVSRMIESALSAYPGVATRIDLPPKGRRSAVVFVTPKHGADRQVSVDPGTGAVLGSVIYANTLVGLANTIHGSLAMGIWGSRMLEVAACWALFLIISGFYMWWPRGRIRLAGWLYPRLQQGRQTAWRDLHVVVGVWCSITLVFTLMTGLPWATVEGKYLQAVATKAGVGYPLTRSTLNPPASMPMKQALGSAPWTLETMPMPTSAPRTSGHEGHAGFLVGRHSADPATIRGVDAVVQTLAERHQLASDYRLFLPIGPTGVYTAFTYPGRPQGQRSLYFDRWSGQLLKEVDFQQYGWVGKGVELGVQLHIGSYFGLANQLLMLIPCLAVMLLVISGFIMWWRRRPAGGWGAPTTTLTRPMGGMLALLVLAAIAMPMFGISLIAACLIDWLIGRIIRKPHSLA